LTFQISLNFLDLSRLFFRLIGVTIPFSPLRHDLIRYIGTGAPLLAE